MFLWKVNHEINVAYLFICWRSNPDFPKFQPSIVYKPYMSNTFKKITSYYSLLQAVIISSYLITSHSSFLLSPLW